MVPGVGGNVNRLEFGKLAKPRPVPCRRAPVRSEQGFTLVELVITMVVAVILISIAVPSFTRIIATNRLTTTTNEIIAAVNVARMEAVKRNSSIAFCSDSAANNTTDTLGSACGTQVGAIYLLTSGTNTTQVRASLPGIVWPIQLSGSVTALRFSGTGFAKAVGATAPYGGTVADICTTATSADNHQKITMSTGSIMAVTSYTGTCP